jgi:hypothetical protein
VDATTKNTADESLKAVAIARNDGDTAQHTLDWLSRCNDKWLLFFDNADNLESSPLAYFPKGGHSDILITTRNSGRAVLAAGKNSTCLVQQMPLVDGKTLLLSVARIHLKTLQEDHDAEVLVQVH